MNRYLKTVSLYFLLFNQVNAQNSDSKLASLKAHNKAVLVMDAVWMRDPYIELAPDGYYYLSVTRRNESFADQQASMQFFRSKNLVDWDDMGVQWRADNSTWGRSVIEKGKSKGNPAMIWAPEAHFINGRWVIVSTSNQQSANLYQTQGADLQAPFEEPFGTNFGPRHDPSIFVDDDQTPWLVYACTRIIQLKKDFSGFVGEPITIASSNRKMGHEGSYIIKFNNKYVMFATGWSTDSLRHGTYNLYYTVSDRLSGGYGERKFAGRFLGHGTPFQDKEGRWWCTAFMNGEYRSPEQVSHNDVDPAIATTINKQGLTLVPIDINLNNGEVQVTVLDPDYARPGKEERQKF